MGMFNKDKAFGGTRLDKWIDEGETFILWDCHVLPEPVPTQLGDARKSVLLVSAMDAQGLAEEVGTLASAIADKVEEKQDGDLPAIVRTERVESSHNPGVMAYVLTFVSEFSPTENCVNKDTGEMVYEVSGKKK